VGAAGHAKGSAVTIDEIDNAIASSFCISGKFLSEIRALQRDRRYEPGDQASKGEKRDGEKKSYRFGTTEPASAHFGDERVKQISENYGNSDRNQDRLKEANDIGASPDDCANYHDKKYNE
jgi:hypothetical protein